MARVEVAQPRATIVDSADYLKITVPSRKNWFLILFVGFWMCAWLFGEVSVLRVLFHAPSKLGGTQIATAHPSGGADLFLFGWLGAWTVGGCVAGYAVLWSAVGKEIVVLSATALTTKRDILGLGPVRDYDLVSVRNLRYDSARGNRADEAAARLDLIGGGNIAFDYGAKTYRFGSGIDEPEARKIIGLLESRHHFESEPSS